MILVTGGLLCMGLFSRFCQPRPAATTKNTIAVGISSSTAHPLQFARVLLVANMPTIVCTICAAFLAYTRVSDKGLTPSGPRHEISSRQVRP